MYMIEITEDKASDLSENIEKALKYMGKAMQCIEQMMEGSESMGERGNFGQRGPAGGSYETRAGGGGSGGGSMGSRNMYGSRFDDDDEDDDMGERRRRRR